MKKLNFLLYMKILCYFFIFGIFLDLQASEENYYEQLSSIDTFMGIRRTNVGCHSTLYPAMNLALAMNCHPYNPNDIAGDSAFACASHPLVIKYNPILVREILPSSIQQKLDAAGSTCQLFLNVQDNPWNGTQVLLRAHAFLDFFPCMGTNYQEVSVFVCRADGAILLNQKNNVHLHDGVASPNNFLIAGLDHTRDEDFYSIVTYQSKTIITHHILLTVSARERFQDFLYENSAEIIYSPCFFAPLLAADYSAFLVQNEI